MFTCSGEHHKGVRELALTEKGHGSLCKECKRLVSRMHNEKKALERSAAKVGRFSNGLAWLECVNEHCRNGGKFFKPERVEFTSDDAFEAAKALEDIRKSQGGVNRKSKREYMDKDNEKKREEYAENKKTEEGREKLKEKQQMDDENKRARKESAIAQGMAWCAHGSHAVPDQDMIFDAVEDLDLDLCKPGICRHYACIKHFEAYIKIQDTQQRRLKNPTCIRLQETRASAKKRGIEWTVSDEKASEVLNSQSCHYCVRPFQESAPGLDRVNPYGIYEDANVVACCSDCNMAKGGLTETEFLTCCHAIAEFMTNGIANKQFIPYRRIVRRPFDVAMNAGVTTASTWEGAETFLFGTEKWLLRTVLCKGSIPYRMYKYDAGRRGISFHIEKDEFHEICSKPCHYCGLQAADAIGMDRVDSDGPYSSDNVVPCCCTCNMLKRQLSVDEFGAMILAVHSANR